ncbi:MAG: cytochrome c oxidase subunit, partial [Pseudomonadota bacterium]
MKKVRGLLGACAMLFCGVVAAQVKDMPGGPRVNQLNLPDGVTQIAKDIAWLHWFMLIVCMVIFIAV